MLEAQSGKLPPRQRRLLDSSVAIKKKRTTVAKVPIHFIGFPGNADHSLAGIGMGHGFAVEHRSIDDVVPFLRKIDKYDGLQRDSGLLRRS
jgi:hypothetical protein